MKKLLYLSFCLVMVAGIGCALTDYPLITDNDQMGFQPGSHHSHHHHPHQAPPAGYTVDTVGKAHVQELSRDLWWSNQIATLWPDGADELIWFVDQKHNGDQTLYTYNNYSTDYPIFHDDLYCQPDWDGCAVTKATNLYVDDATIFDYTANTNCLGYRSLYLLYAITGNRYGECGRTSFGDNMRVMNAGVETSRGMRWNFSAANTTLFLNNNAGYVEMINMATETTLDLSKVRNNKVAALDLSSPTWGPTFRQVSQFAKDHGGAVTAELTYMGVTKSFNVKILPSALDHKILTAY